MPKEIDESFLTIDLDSLDDEWKDQPDLFFKYAKKKSRLEKEHDEAEAELSVVKSELDKKIRKKPEAYGIKKISEKAIESAIILENEYQDALAAVHEAKYKLNIAKDAVKALEQRCKALENEVKLWAANYFSDPKADDSSREAVDEIERRSKRKKQAIRQRDDDDD